MSIWILLRWRYFFKYLI